MRRWGLCVVLLHALPARALQAAQLSLVQAVALTNSTHSWELGTETEALLELDDVDMSVYGNPSLPNPTPNTPTGVVNIVMPIVSAQPAAQQQIITDGSAADPASLGVAVLVANASLGSSSGIDWVGSATKQLNTLLYQTPRTSDGAISHRTEQVQLWSDFVYMAPPFIAYYGAMTMNQTLLQVAYQQCQLYRQYLATSSGCWEHIILGNPGSFDDLGLWATGNGWAAAGMMRVYMTIARTTYAGAMTAQLSDLATWIGEILGCAWPNLDSKTQLFHNYLDNATSFDDASSTAILAATTYRYASAGLGSSNVGAADTAYQSITNAVNATTGVLSPVVDPENYSLQMPVGQVSPEGQSFVMLLEAAHRDYYAGNITISVTATPSALPATSRSTSPTIRADLEGWIRAICLSLGLMAVSVAGGVSIL